MPLFMDRHDLPGATAEDVASAHTSDLSVAGRHGVEFLAYWFNSDSGSVFCFARARSSEAVQAVHAESHGIVANEVIAVAESDVVKFLGAVHDPANASEQTTAFRAILFTDIEGSTALLNRLGEAEYMVVLTEHDLIVRRALAAWRGREVKHTGDGLMASFDHVENALRCALAAQAGLAARPVSETSPELRVRMGIAAGQPVFHDRDIFGQTVHLAARLCAAASGGQILVAESVSGHPEAAAFTFGPPAAVELRGFADPVLVCPVLGGPT